MNSIQNGKYIFTEEKVRAFSSNQNALTVAEIATKTEEQQRTRNYIARYNGLEGVARIAKIFNDCKKAISDYIVSQEVVNVMSVRVGIGSKFNVLDENGSPKLDEEGNNVTYVSDKEETYLVVDFDKNGSAVLVRSPLGDILNMAVTKEDKQRLNALLNDVCNVLVESVSIDRLQYIYLIQLPDKQIEEKYKQHINAYLFCEVETKDSFRRSLLPILQSALINHITYSGKDLIQIMNDKCYNSFFQSLVITLNKEAIPKKAKKCDIKALKSYIIEQITERTAAELEELITKVLNEFN